jgi:hypothetical protein
VIRLVPVGDLRPSAYNPRQADEERLALVELSLRKLGFLLPLVADEAGEIISGHQRHLVAVESLGLAEVPVLRVKIEDEDKRKALNIVFNRATNDMRVGDHSPDMTRALMERRVVDLAAALPDAEDLARCLKTEAVPVSKLAKWARSSYDPHMRNMARALERRAGVTLPVVATKGGRVVNGAGRVQYASETERASLPVVWISEAEADFAHAMLNLLSMDFTIKERYADLLRHNSFRRAFLRREHLGTGFTFLVNKKGGAEFNIADPKAAAVWRRTYGNSVVDFGAGHMHETRLLRAAGIHVAAFEPYRTEKNEILKDESVALGREFLADVASGRPYSSIFVSSVLNSIPFEEDRDHVMVLCAALMGEGSRFFCNPLSVNDSCWTAVMGEKKMNFRRQKTASFKLDYEPGVLLGDFMDKPKVQKYYTGEEAYRMLKRAFGKVSVKPEGHFLAAMAADPLPLDVGKLRRAIEFEFDLPYPDGSRMGLVSEALAAFSARIGRTI